MATLNSQPVVSAVIHEPAFGRWWADVIVSADSLDTAAALEVDGVTWTGTVVTQELDGARLCARVVGGNDSLTQALPSKYYSGGVSLQTVIGDILSECGETLAADSDAALLASSLPAYERHATTADDALRAALRLHGASWRMTRAGEVRIVPETLTGTEYTGGVRVTEIDQTQITVGVDAPTIEPGHIVSGQVIRRVTWYLSRVLRAQLTYVETPTSGTVDRTRYEGSISTAGVNSQASDGSLELIPNGRYQMTSVPFHGLPGCNTSVPAGCQVLVGFSEGDPRKPVAFGVRSTGGLRLGTLLLAQNAVSLALLSPQFFPASTAGDAAAAAAKAVILGAGNTAFDLSIETTDVEVS